MTPPDLPSLLFGTFNPHKVREVQQLLAGRYRIRSGVDVPDLTEADETGDTLQANALIKARSYHAATGLPCFADDSGLEIDALDGRPGVISSHYAGTTGPGAAVANMAKVLAELEGQPQRTARFRTVIAYLAPGQAPRLFEGCLEGSIAAAPRGTQGFGYDPIFLPFGSQRTLAEHSPEEKNRISHRAKALAAFVAFLQQAG